jgi:hypothetical protein
LKEITVRNDGLVSLQEAIEAANFGASVAMIPNSPLVSLRLKSVPVISRYRSAQALAMEQDADEALMIEYLAVNGIFA